MTQPLGYNSAPTPWWMNSPAGGSEGAGRPSGAASAFAELSSLMVQGAAGTQAFAPAASDADQAWLDKLVTKDGKATGLLTQLTGLYGDGSGPDYIAVRSGSGVTGQFSGGFSVTGSVDGNGTNITYFSTGTPPSAMKGVAISFAPGASAKVRADAIAQAQKYLTDHLDDAQDAHGRWNRPTFDVRV